MPTFVVNEGVPFDRDSLLTEFAADNIDGRVFFWPLSMLPMFHQRPENVVSYALHKRAVNLPTYHDLSEEQMDLVISHVRDCF
jgi:perosamine synthetase